MARPPKKDSEKRRNRHTLYLTDMEDEILREIAKERAMDLTKCFYEALHDWFIKHNNLKE